MLNDTALEVGGNAIAADITHISIHTDTNTASSSAESTAARVPVTWTVTNGDLSASGLSFTGGAASGPAKRVGYWTALTAGTYRGGSLLTGDQAFNAAGEYTVNSVSEPVTAS